MNGAIGIVRSRGMTVVAVQPGMASPIAASADLGIRTMTECRRGGSGAASSRWHVAIAAPPTLGAGLCCFYDGTTDGRFNYSARQDSTLTDPIGSRPWHQRPLTGSRVTGRTPKSCSYSEGDGLYHERDLRRRIRHVLADQEFTRRRNHRTMESRRQHLSTPVASVRRCIHRNRRRSARRDSVGRATAARDGTDPSREFRCLRTPPRYRRCDAAFSRSLGIGGAEFGWIQRRW